MVRVIGAPFAEGLAGTPQAALRLVRHLIAARDRPGSRGSGSNGTKNAFQPSTAAAFDPKRLSAEPFGSASIQKRLSAAAAAYP